MCLYKLFTHKTIHWFILILSITFKSKNISDFFLDLKILGTKYPSQINPRFSPKPCLYLLFFDQPTQHYSLV
jgi:hypothetical protein